jgi:hypothetical protein
VCQRDVTPEIGNKMSKEYPEIKDTPLSQLFIAQDQKEGSMDASP